LVFRWPTRLLATWSGVPPARVSTATSGGGPEPGKTGDALLTKLETRLDAVVLRAGFARTIYQARQAVSHGHVQVDGKKVDKPSYRLRPGQVVEITDRSKDLLPFAAAASGGYAAVVPAYLAVDTAALRARLERLPTRPGDPGDL
jgi:small subunit ribosomal protein S4